MPALMAFMHLVQSELTSPLRARLLSDPAGADQGQDTGKTPNETEALSVLRGSENKKVLLLGAPGSGKSTLLRELAKHSWVAPERIGLEEAHLPSSSYDRCASLRRTVP